jgi:hypothetical protein
MHHDFHDELHRARAADFQRRAEDYRRARRLRDALRRDRDGSDGGGGSSSSSRDNGRPGDHWATAA